MSDNARTSMAFPVVNQPLEGVIEKISAFFESEAIPLLISDIEEKSVPPLFRPIVEVPAKYQRPEILEKPESDPQDMATLIELARKYRNVVIHTTFHFGGQAYEGSVFFYSVLSSTGTSAKERTFFRLSFHSALTSVLRGTKDFGTRILIDREIKAELLRMALELAQTLEARGFIYGLERDGVLPFSIEDLARYLRDPLNQQPPLPPYFVGIDRSLLSRIDLIRTWGDESAIKQTASGFLIVDLLLDNGDSMEEADSDD